MNKCLIALFLISTACAYRHARDERITHKVAMKIRIGHEVIEEPIVFGLFGTTVPKTAENFFQLCTDKALKVKGQKASYDNCPFHRIIPNFMIQGGDFTNKNGTGGLSIYGERFRDENFDIGHDVGVLSMANAGPNTNGSQFFITTAQTPWLNGRHTVFGRVLKNMDLVYQLESEGTPSGKPKKPCSIVECYEYQWTDEETADE